MFLKICAFVFIFSTVTEVISCLVPNLKLTESPLNRNHQEAVVKSKYEYSSPKFGVLGLFSGRPNSKRPQSNGRRKFQKVGKKVWKDLGKAHSLLPEEPDLFPRVKGVNNQNVHHRRFGGLINRQGAPSRKYFGNYDNAEKSPSAKSLKRQARQSRTDTARDTGNGRNGNSQFRKSYGGRSDPKPYAGKNTNGRFSTNQNIKNGQTNERRNSRAPRNYIGKEGGGSKTFQKSYRGGNNNIESGNAKNIYSRTNNANPSFRGAGNNGNKKAQNSRNPKKAFGQRQKSRQAQPKKTRKKSEKKMWSYDDKPKKLKSVMPPYQAVTKASAPKTYSSIFDNLPKVKEEFRKQEAKKERREKIKQENLKQARAYAKPQSKTKETNTVQRSFKAEPVKKVAITQTSPERNAVPEQAEPPQTFNEGYNSIPNRMPSLGQPTMNNVPWMRPPMMQRAGQPMSPANMQQGAVPPRSYDYSSMGRKNQVPPSENSEYSSELFSDDYSDASSSLESGSENGECDDFGLIDDEQTDMPLIGNTTDIYGNLTNATLDDNSTLTPVEITTLFDIDEKLKTLFI